MSDRPRRDSIRKVERFIITHKVIAAAVALIMLGATTATILGRYVSAEDFKSHVHSERLMWEEFRSLQLEHARAVTQLEELEKRSVETRDAITKLLKFVLENPPTVDSGARRRKKR